MLLHHYYIIFRPSCTDIFFKHTNEHAIPHTQTAHTTPTPRVTRAVHQLTSSAENTSVWALPA